MIATEKPTIESQAARSLSKAEFGEQIAPILHAIKSCKDLPTAIDKAKLNILEFLGAGSFHIYQNVLNGKELKSYYRAGPLSDSRDLDLIIPFSPTSPVGYVALNHRAIFIDDINDHEKLINIHPQLNCKERFGNDSRELAVKSMIVAPIKDDILFGVIQVMTLGNQELRKQDILKVKVFSQILARSFKTDIKSVQGPFDYLVQLGVISDDQLNEVRKSAFQNNRKITKILVEDYDIDPDDIGLSLEHFYHVPYMKFDPTVRPSACFMGKIETKYLKKNLWVPIAGDEEEAVVLIDDPGDRQRIFEIDKILNAKNYVIKVGLASDILRYLEDSDEESDGSSMANVLKLLEEKGKPALVEDEVYTELGEQMASSSAMVQLVKRIIIEACDMGGSDIHIEPGKYQSPGVVRVRVDGDCKLLQEIPREHMQSLIARIKVISGMDISERRLPQDGKCIETIRGRPIDLRATTYPTDGGESAVLRILPHGSVTPLNKLNLSEANYDNIKKIASKQHGMFLVVGPTGVGKTVTLHAVLDYLNEPGVKIWTAEDPIEITQTGLQQMQMKPKIGLTFASSMRAFLRGDPDVILVGEMRDSETASIAIEGSLTGHLVLSTLHSNSATETITRLLNLGMEPVDFSDALLGIMSQRLVKTLCDDCKTSYEPSAKELDFLIESYGEEFFPELEMRREDIRLYRPIGCKRCEETGYRGRTAIHELLSMSAELHQMIFDKAPQTELKEQATKDGMRTLKQDGIYKIFLGMTDYTQLNRVVSD